MQKKETTIIRKIDELGRLVLPKDIRKKLDIHNGDMLELTCTQDSLSITKYSNIQEIGFLSEVLLDTIYECYRIEGILLEENEILRYPTLVSKKKIEKKLAEEEFISLPITLENREVGQILLFTKDEKYLEILSFLASFLKKYLEENQ